VAIEEYNAELVKRGADEVETSRRNALLVHDFGRFYSIRNESLFLLWELRAWELCESQHRHFGVVSLASQLLKSLYNLSKNSILIR
jgi:hypothetical protein